MRGRETPLPHRLHSAVVEPAAEAAQNAHVADGAVAPDHDLELDVSADVLTARVVGVVRFHFLQQPRRIDAAAGTIGSAAGPAPGAGPDAAALAFAEAGTLAAAGAATDARTVAVVLRCRLRKHADPAAIIRWCR